MSDIEFLVQTSKRFEQNLVSHYGADGRGLSEKAKSVQFSLPDNVFKALRYIAHERNRVMHDSYATGINDRSKLTEMINIADTHFNRAQYESNNFAQQNHYQQHGNNSKPEYSEYENNEDGFFKIMLGPFLLLIKWTLVNPIKFFTPDKTKFSRGGHYSKFSDYTFEIKGQSKILSRSLDMRKNHFNLSNEAKQFLTSKDIYNNKLIDFYMEQTGDNFIINEDMASKLNNWIQDLIAMEYLRGALRLNFKSTFVSRSLPTNLIPANDHIPSSNLEKIINKTKNIKGLKLVSSYSFLQHNHIETLEVVIDVPKVVVSMKLNHKIRKDKLTLYIHCPSTSGSPGYNFSANNNSLSYSSHDFTILTEDQKGVLTSKNSTFEDYYSVWEDMHDSVFINNDHYINHLNNLLREYHTSIISSKVCAIRKGDWTHSDKVFDSIDFSKPYSDKDKDSFKKLTNSLKEILREHKFKITQSGMNTDNYFIFEVEGNIPAIPPSLNITTRNIRLSFLVKI